MDFLVFFFFLVNKLEEESEEELGKVIQGLSVLRNYDKFARIFT